MQRPEPDPPAAPLFRLVYHSVSTLPPDATPGGPQDSGLADILRTARSNNARDEVTGALLYRQGRFAQVLEGSETAVNATYAGILADPRHHHIELCEAGPVNARLFGRWAMALVEEGGSADRPIVALTGGIAQASPWRVNPGQEEFLAALRALVRGSGGWRG